MKKTLIYFTLAVLFLIIESTLAQAVLPPLLIPDVILIMVFYLGFHRVSIEGVLITFILGYLADAFAGGIIGLSSFTLLLIFILTSRLSKIVALNSLLIKIGGAAFMSILKGTATYIFLRFLNQEIPFYIIFPIAVSTALISPFVINVLQKTELYFASRKSEPRYTPP